MLQLGSNLSGITEYIRNHITNGQVIWGVLVTSTFHSCQSVSSHNLILIFENVYFLRKRKYLFLMDLLLIPTYYIHTTDNI